MLAAGPFRKKPPWTDINRIDAEALLEFGEKVTSLKELFDRAAFHCMCECCPLCPCMAHTLKLESIAGVRSFDCLQSIEHLLVMLLTWTAQAIMGADMVGTPCPELLPLLGAPVLDLLDDKLPISQAVRSAVLHLLRLLIASLRDAHADEVCIPACSWTFSMD